MSLNIKSDNNKIKVGLYIVATPIGNLKDMSHLERSRLVTLGQWSHYQILKQMMWLTK